ncbi:MAG: gliding motility protein GldC [Flavobacteriales bacterium]|jgi:gliding motility-associated protein GldC|nr:gliding motility protein GldC [Flavobacteriales bacterium]
MSKKAQVNIDVELDVNHVPESMTWTASEMGEGGLCKAALISIWDSTEQNTLKLDLWTKDMPVEEMKIMFHQTLLSMADSFGRATGEEKMAHQMREFARFFAEELKLLRS